LHIKDTPHDACFTTRLTRDDFSPEKIIAISVEE